MADSIVPFAWVRSFRRHERRLAVAWLAAAGLLVASAAITPLRVRTFAAVGAALDWWDDRWLRRLTVARRLVEERRFAEAEPYLERLDAGFPARTSRHGWDREREYLLRLLARSQEGNGRTGRTMATWARLVAFDSLNYRNHYDFARAADRLLSGWALAPEARDGYARALALFPSHLPSLRGYLDFYVDRGEWKPVVAAYQTYLDAFLVERVEVSIGDATLAVPVIVDGRAHDTEVALPATASGAVLRIAPPGLPIEVERVELIPALVVGRASGAGTHRLPANAVQATGMTRTAGAWLTDDSTTTGTAALSAPLPSGTGEVASLRLRLCLFKPVDPDVWAAVEKAHRNLLDPAGLAAALERTALFPSAVSADAALERLPWAHQGLRPPRHD